MFTAAGRECYNNGVVRYTVRFPTAEVNTRINNSKWIEETWLASTATPLGEIQVPAALSEAEQRKRVLEQAEAWIATLPNDEGVPITTDAGGSDTLVLLRRDVALEVSIEKSWSCSRRRNRHNDRYAQATS